MKSTRTRIAVVAGTLALVAALPRAAHAAEAFHGIAGASTLVTFHSDAPGAIRTAVPVTGLQPGEQLLALDLRPATGQLYALGSTSRIYVISPASGAARAAGDPFSPPLAGSHFAIDFNTAVDRIRLLSDGRQNLRINPENGAVAAQDPSLDYAAGDEGAGSNPQVGAAAHSNDGSSLWAIDTARDVLVKLPTPNDGKLSTVGPLGVDIGEPTSMDVSGDGTVFASGRPSGGREALFTVDPETGVLAPAGAKNAISDTYGGVRAITAAGPVPDDTAAPAFLLDLDRHQSRRKLRRSLRVALSCNEACSVFLKLESGGRRLATGGGDLAGPGRETFRLRANRRARKLGRRSGTHRTTLRVRVEDAAGNTTTGRRTVLFE